MGGRHAKVIYVFKILAYLKQFSPLDYNFIGFKLFFYVFKLEQKDYYIDVENSNYSKIQNIYELKHKQQETQTIFPSIQMLNFDST